MPISTAAARIVLPALGACVAAALVAPAPAAARSKAPTVTVGKNVFRDPSSKLCMPRTVLGRAATKDLPETMCHTRDEWTGKGVTFVVK